METPPNEPVAVFPDPDGERHPDVRPGSDARHPPKTAEGIINSVIMRVTDDIWEHREGNWYCMLCAPGGYKIRAGADPQWHELMRLPDTHKRNVIWFTIQCLIRDYGKVPGWPDCYREHHKGLWCHICRAVVGLYGQEEGEKHDAVHIAWQHIPMRPGRLTRKFRGERTRGRRHYIDEVLAAREEGYDPAREAAASRGVFGDAPQDPDRPAAIEGAFTARRGTSWQDKMGYHFADNSVPTGEKLYIVKDEETGLSKQVTAAHLDEWIEMHTGIGDKVTRWRNSCNYGHHITAGVIRPCIGEGCECNCHSNADLTEPADPDA